MDDITYLRSLNDKLWEKVIPGAYKPFLMGLKEKRIILFSEFNKVCEILSEDNSIRFTIHNDCMGFGIGMTLRDNSNPMAILLHINQKHFSPENHFDDAWPIFEQLAKRFPHKLTETLREKSYYEY